MTESCFHCDLPIPSDSHFSVLIEGEQRPMCCPGCQAVAQAIVDNGLSSFYNYRTEKAQNPEQALEQVMESLSLYDRPDLQKDFVKNDGEHIRHASLILEGIVCAACVWLNERHVMALVGVQEFSVNYSTHRATVKWDDEKIHLSDILQAIASIGYVAHPFDPGRQQQVQKKERSLAMRRLVIAGLGAMQVMMLAVAMYAGESQGMDADIRRFMRWVSLVITVPVIFYSASVFFISAWRDIRHRQVGMDVPVSMAIGAAFAASIWATVVDAGEIYFDSVTMFSFFLLAGRYLEMMARHRAGQAAEDLIRVLPTTATRIGEHGDEVVSAAELLPGDHVRIRPGETVPSDGIVTAGCSAVDESLLTGESIPVARTEGSAVFGGSVNVDSPLQVRIDKVGEDTVLSSIVRLLERAQTEKPRIAQLADRVAGWFVTVILILASVIAWYWWTEDAANAFRITLSVLVVTCPCALSLATPVALVAATGQLTRTGLLTTRGHALETLARATHVIFDKTGTLTTGRLQLEKVINYNCESEQQAIDLAAAVETGSEHPVARAIMEAARDKMDACDSSSVTGLGIEASINGKRYRVGRASFIEDLNAGSVESDFIDANKTTVILADENKILARFILSDSLRDEAAESIAALRKRDVNISLLSGDQAEVVEHIAAQLGIEDAHAQMLPQQKLEFIQALQAKGEVVVMVGDGVNDAPVLAAAQVSIAMGGGTQIAQASADMILLSEQLMHVSDGLVMARRTMSVVRQNLSWALIYNLTALPLAAAGMIAPWMAALGMSFSSLVVVVNALRLSK